jgi:hypothetical protein
MAEQIPSHTRAIRFAIGVAALAAVVAACAAPVRWPGPVGEAFSWNLAHGEDVGALFYTEVDRYRALERALEARRQGRPVPPQSSGSR